MFSCLISMRRCMESFWWKTRKCPEMCQLFTPVSLLQNLLKSLKSKKYHLNLSTMNIEEVELTADIHLDAWSIPVWWIATDVKQSVESLVGDFSKFSYLWPPPSHLSNAIVSLHTEPEDVIFRDYMWRAVWYLSPNWFTFYSREAAKLVHLYEPLPSLEDIYNFWDSQLVVANNNIFVAGYSIVKNETPWAFNLWNGMLYQENNKLFIWLDDWSVAVFTKDKGLSIIPPHETVGMLAPIIPISRFSA